MQKLLTFLFLAIFLAILFKWNKALSFAFSNISIPPMIPFIIFASLKVGELFVGENTLFFSENKLTFEVVKNHLAQYVIGSFVLAILTAALFGFVSYFLLSIFKKAR